MRLNRHLSLCGLGSRRGCEQIILDGRVTVNGKRVIDLATQVAPADKVTVDGKPAIARSAVVIALNKPRGYLCTRDDTHNRPTVYDLLPERFHQLHHVGRLDMDSEGLLLLTNQGDLSQRLLHPSEGVDKEYEVRVEEKFDPQHLASLLKGVLTKEGYARAERAWLGNPWLVHVVLKQGLKRQIREMFFCLGYEVERLMRVRIGGLWVKGISKGHWRELDGDEVDEYFQSRNAKARTVIKRKAKAKAVVEGDEDYVRPSAPAAKPTPKVKPESKTLPKKKKGFEHEDLTRTSAASNDETVRQRPRRPIKPATKKSVGGSRAKYTQRQRNERPSKSQRDRR